MVMSPANVTDFSGTLTQNSLLSRSWPDTSAVAVTTPPAVRIVNGPLMSDSSAPASRNGMVPGRGEAHRTGQGERRMPRRHRDRAHGQAVVAVRQDNGHFRERAVRRVVVLPGGGPANRGECAEQRPSGGEQLTGCVDPEVVPGQEDVRVADRDRAGPDHA